MPALCLPDPNPKVPSAPSPHAYLAGEALMLKAKRYLQDVVVVVRGTSVMLSLLFPCAALAILSLIPRLSQDQLSKSF